MLLDSRYDRIAHSGVKGMKWGVRRKLKRGARKIGGAIKKEAKRQVTVTPEAKSAAKKIGKAIKKEAKRQVTVTPEGKRAAKKIAANAGKINKKLSSKVPKAKSSTKKLVHSLLVGSASKKISLKNAATHNILPLRILAEARGNYYN